MASSCVSIDDYLAEASPLLGRMRLDGLTETAVPFAECVVLVWRRGAPTPDMNLFILIAVLEVCFMFYAHTRRAACALPQTATSQGHALRVSRPHKRTH